MNSMGKIYELVSVRFLFLIIELQVCKVSLLRKKMKYPILVITDIINTDDCGRLLFN
ncbi:hypothetical protein SAMN05216412_11223 [Nitrosospira multiformis]|uniref:Uncharacterized protein n=1 Tax=Nitrosospira multiformis TaxID=1231 RepID=A0A1I0G848_9PROT|nr:hypothetical protein SAMN05216412_11223 [Nitrosospira multiformis]